MSRSNFINTRFERQIETHFPALEAAGLATSYTLYRRQNPVQNDLGETIAPWASVATDLKMVFAATKDGVPAWEIRTTGQHQTEILQIFTGYDDLREGDNLLLASDNKMYLVEKSNPYAGLRTAWITTAGAQHRV